MCGIPFMVAGCNVAITQPAVKDICAFGEDRFFLALNLFIKCEKMVEEIKMGNSQLSYLSDFQVLMVVLEQEKEAQASVKDLFELIFPNYICEFDTGCFIFKLPESNKIVGRLDPMNFENFQNALETLFLPRKVGEDQEIEYKPANAAAAAIAEKLKRGNEIRQRQAAEKNKGNNPQSLFATYTSSLAIGLGMDINTLFAYTPFQLYDAFTRYNKKTSYDLYQKISTTPMMDVSKMEAPDIWFGDIYNQ